MLAAVPLGATAVVIVVVAMTTGTRVAVAAVTVPVAVATASAEEVANETGKNAAMTRHGELPFDSEHGLGDGRCEDYQRRSRVRFRSLCAPPEQSRSNDSRQKD
jgi:hypothetical protein